MKDQTSLNAYFQQSIRENWNIPALTDFKGQSFQYSTVARKIAKLHIMFESAGIKRGDKIALCGRNSAHWAIAMIATLTYGAVAVPILHEFKPDTVHHLVNHSEARILFVDNAANENLDREAMPALEGAILIGDYSLVMSRNEKLTNAREHLNEMFGRRYPERFTGDDVVYRDTAPDEIAVINYTSGSTGFSKGVMLSEHALWSNMRFCLDNIPFINPGDQMICMLPLAHMYGLMVEMLFPFAKGCHVNFLTRTPSPKIIIDAFAAIKPKLIVTVPLVIEKIIKTRVFPLLEKPMMKLLLHVPFVDDHLLGKIKDKLTQTFGGNCHEVIIGGAGLNKDVEAFLRLIKFPYTVGYGMTECGPLIAYTYWKDQKEQSCGRCVDRMEIRVDSPDPANTPGVLWVKGDNVMKGYYKNPDATAAVFKDGWMNTGDICQVDNDGYIFIRGRDKNLILGPSGQNIYPEEIEQKLNNMPYVGESLVVDAGGGKLRALLHPDFENAEKQGLTSEELDAQMHRNVEQLNSEMPAYSKISDMTIMYEEFEKTPKRSIKRYLYQN
ncbi:MAG: AMP-binding protein [Bacteroidales bacterium]|nr:AMP-binding protein [Bacteroidales bacterium]